jgi:transcriptional regulator with XRE-family HTH domain
VLNPASFTTFGDLLKHLRLRAQLTQRELALAVGYNHAHLSRLESNQRVPEAATLKALFFPALGLEDQPEWASRLLALAAQARGERLPGSGSAGAALASPRLPVSLTPLLGRDAASAAARDVLLRPEVRLLTLVGPPGIGKTRLAAHIASEAAGQFADGAENQLVVASVEIRIHQLVGDAVIGVGREHQPAKNGLLGLYGLRRHAQLFDAVVGAALESLVGSKPLARAHPVPVSPCGIAIAIRLLQ